MKEKTFYRAFLDFSLRPDKTQNFLKDKRLTSAEKLILSGYLKVRDNQNQEALDMLVQSSPSPSPFVESQRLVLIGSALNNLSRFLEAETYLRDSVKILEKMEDVHYFHFLSYFTLFCIYANLNRTTSMEEMIQEMRKVRVVNDNQNGRILRCEFTYYQMTQDNEKASLTLKEIEPIESSFSESDSISFLIDKFIFQVQIDQFDSAYETLNNMRQYRKFHLSENYKYMKKLLDNLTKDVPLYVYERDFINIPILFHQLNVIVAMEEKKNDKALQHWEQLKKISPADYQDDFTFKGSKCLFSLCLDKHLVKVVGPAEFKIPEGASKVEALLELLQQSKAPLHGSFIFESLWGRSPELKEDLIKVSRLVYTAKMKKKVNIKYHKGTFELVKSSIKKVS